MTQVNETALQGIVRTIVKAANLHKIILFGSAARGRGREDSDIDILVVVPASFGKMRNRSELYADLMDSLARFGVAIDLLLFPQPEMNEWQLYRNHVISRALREGKVLYEKTQTRHRAFAKSTR